MEEEEAQYFVIQIEHIQDRYEIIKDIGKGTYGDVQKCRDKITNKIVAVKKVKTLKNKQLGLPQTTLREVRLLRELRHPNIIELINVVQSEDTDENLFLIFEYCEYDLYSLLYIKKLDIKHIKSIMKQFLIVLQYCAGQKVIHRDLKPENMFITRNCTLKLGDFGLARKVRDDRNTRYSTNVITLWYRPPEILCNNESKGYNYKSEIDIWSAGCILYEMVAGEQLFRAKENNVASQLTKIASICGPIPPEISKLIGMPKNEKIPNKSQLDKFLKERFEHHPDFMPLIPVLLEMLKYQPSERISAEKALNDPFFREIDSTYDPSNIPEIDIDDIHQREVNETRSQKARPSSQERLDELRTEKTFPPVAIL